MAWTADKEQQYRALRTERAGAMAGLINALPRTLLEGVQPPSEEEFAETLAGNAAELVHALTAFLPGRASAILQQGAQPDWPDLRAGQAGSLQGAGNSGLLQGAGAMPGGPGLPNIARGGGTVAAHHSPGCGPG